MMNILVTGGAGFGWLPCIEKLHAMADMHVVVFDNLTSGSAENVPQGMELVTEMYGICLPLNACLPVIRLMRSYTLLHRPWCRPLLPGSGSGSSDQSGRNPAYIDCCRAFTCLMSCFLPVQLCMGIIPGFPWQKQKCSNRLHRMALRR